MVREIVLLFHRYSPRYNPKTKVLRLYKSIPVKELMRLRAVIKDVGLDVENIRVNR